MHTDAPLRCILFDLDGTLLDTAPDLIAALNAALEEEGYPALAPERLRPLISRGAAYMIEHGVGHHCPEQHHGRILERMLSRYSRHIADATRLYDGMESVLSRIEEAGLAWGIVTNKLSRYTEPLLTALDLAQRPGCIISGDTTPTPKPHPEPLFEASRRLAIAPAECVYVGDSARDIEAGRRAGMSTLAAAYGYLAADDDPADWGACGLLAAPQDLLHWLPGSTPP